MPHFASWPDARHANSVINTINDMLRREGWQDCGVHALSRSALVRLPDLVVIHWPDKIFWGDPPTWKFWLRLARVLSTLTLFRLCGTRVVWVVHNLNPHDVDPERRRVWKPYTSILARLASGWLTLAPATSEPVVEAFPGLRRRPRAFIWHPPYRWTSPVGAGEARRTLGYAADETIFAHVGVLRPYKGLSEFVRLFATHSPSRARLVLAGFIPSERYREELTASAAETASVTLRQGHLDGHTYNLYLQAADVFVAPYGAFLHSGAIVHALCRGCLVIAPDAPFTRDLARVVGEAWIIRVTGQPSPTTLAAACARAIQLRQHAPELEVLEPEANLDRLRGFLAVLGLRPGTTAPA
jgi:beta-1,4-mannosyltransferase